MGGLLTIMGLLQRKKRQRRNIPLKRRKRIIKRDGKCRYCGGKFDTYHIDHIIPIARGGSDWSTNLVAACSFCNSKKSDNIWWPIPLGFHRVIYGWILAFYYGDIIPAWKDFF